MEKIPIRSSHPHGLYASQPGPASARKSRIAPDSGSEPVTGKPKEAGEGKGGGPCARSQDGDTFTLSIEARTLQIAGSTALESAEKTDSGPAQGTGRTGTRRHAFPDLSDSQDVADRVLEQWVRDQAAKGGSKSAYAEGIKNRLAGWKPSSGRVTAEYLDFRSQVRTKLALGLDAWAVGDETRGVTGSKAEPGAGAGTQSPGESGI